jgi:hypothetical protein
MLRVQALEERAVPAAQIDFATRYAFADEGSSVTITALRTGDSDGTVSAGLTFIEGTANAADYTVPAGSFEWAAGEMGGKSLTIAINDDSTNESFELFKLKLANAAGSIVVPVLGTNEMEVEIDRSDAVTVDAKHPLRFSDDDLDKVTVKFGGKGKAMVNLNDFDGDGHGSIDFIDVKESDQQSTLTVSVAKVADGLVDIGTVYGSELKSLNASKSNLVGDGALFDGYVGSFRFNSLVNGAGINSEADSLQTSRKTTIAIQGAVGDRSYVAAFIISKLTAGSFAKGSNLYADSIGTMTIHGNFSANIVVYGQFIDHAKGQNAVGSINVQGALNDSIIDVTGNIGSVSVNEFVNSRLYGGYIPGHGFDIVTTKIGSFRTSANQKLGLTGKFANSTIYADTLKSATLANVIATNNGTPIGVVVDTAYGSVTFAISGAKSTTKNSDLFAPIDDFDVAVI